MKYPSCIPCGRPKENAPSPMGARARYHPASHGRPCLIAPVTGRPGGRYCRSRPRLGSHVRAPLCRRLTPCPALWRAFGRATLSFIAFTPYYTRKRRACQRAACENAQNCRMGRRQSGQGVGKPVRQGRLYASSRRRRVCWRRGSRLFFIYPAVFAVTGFPGALPRRLFCIAGA